MNDTCKTELYDILCEFEGKICWAAVAGPGSGSRIALDFGKKIERERPLKNTTLTDEVRFYKSEYSLFIEDCSWRLEQNQHVLCSSKSSNKANGEMVRSLGGLVGCRIVSISTSPPGYDLLVAFTNGFTLRLFSDCMDQEADGDNYTFFTPHRVVRIAPRGEVFFQQCRGGK